MPSPALSTRRIVHALLLIVAAAFLALHWFHLKADFPNQSPWQDWSKYTDEGWYGDAAIRHFQLGHWYVPGDFNPAAALPVWPLLEGFVFFFTGVSLAAARALTVAVFAGIVIATWLLIRKEALPPDTSQGSTHHLAAPAAVLLLAVSPFCFNFTRLAILEPLLVLLTLLALLAATFVKLPLTLRRNLIPIVALGLLLPAMVLTKTTALFLFPAIAWMLFARSGYRIGQFLRIAFPAGMLAVTLWLAYYFIVVQPHYLVDYRYLFSANAYTGIDSTNAVKVISDTFRDANWFGEILYPCALGAAIFALCRPRRLRAHPLVPSLLLWIAGYMSFLAYHNNLQPRYYLVVAVPMTLLLPVVLEQFVLPRRGKLPIRLGLGIAAAALLVTIAVRDAAQTLKYVRFPQYTLLHAAQEIHDTIASDPGHSQLVLSISGSDLSLMTGLPSICDDFGTLELQDRIKRYQPGWYVAWNQIDDDKMDSITPFYHVERVAAFPAMDDPERNLLILYRLDPTIVTPPLPRKPVNIPRSLRTKVGQQPSTTQLIH